MSEMEQLVERMTGVQDSLKKALGEQKAELAKVGETSAATAKQIAESTKDFTELREEMKTANETAEKRQDELEKKLARFEEDEGEQRKAALSPGEAFTESKEYEDFIKNGDNNSRTMRMKSLFPNRTWGQDPESKAVLLSSATTRFIAPQRLPGILGPVLRQLRIRDLIPVRRTTSNAIEYIREIGFAVDGAASGTQTHGAAAEVAENALKPEAQMEFDTITKPVETIAHWLPATRQVLADKSQLMAYINDRLRYGVLYKEDTQLLYGTGTSPQIQGLLTEPGIQVYTESTDGQILDTPIDSLRRAMTMSHVLEYTPTGIVLNPTPWEGIQLAKGSDDHYIWLNVSTGTEERFFLLPLVITNAIAQTEALVGSFAMGTTIWDREDVSVRVAEQHDVDFTSNRVTILAEERMMQSIYRPDAFVKVTLDGAPLS